MTHEMRLPNGDEPAKPKLWRDMTPEEKDALLLAHHEGKVIEWRVYGKWKHCPDAVGKHGRYAYRVRPEPTRETFTLWIYPDGERGLKIGTIDLIDGQPDLASIRMEQVR